ncbi:MAG: class I SAM-dependent methyltransferase [Halarsenatibacteraceae bacterium]
MEIPQAVEFSHYLLARQIDEGDFVIDATCGNGHDTGFLARLVGEFGRVLALDIQKDAIETTEMELKERNLLEQVELRQADHSNLLSLLESEELRPTAIVSNLGYLPGGDKSIVTEAAKTLPALKDSLELLGNGGILVVTAYPGHEEGLKEREEIEAWAENLNYEEFNAAHYRFINQKKNPPEVFAIQKR